VAAVGATFGKSYLHTEDIGDCCYAGYLIRFSPNENLHPGFAAYWTESPHYWAQVNARVVQSTVQNFSAGKFRELAIVLPPISEQLAIVAFLDHETAKIDALIAEQERLLALLAEKRQAVVSHVVTKGLNPAVPIKDSGLEWLGEIPVHWNLVRLKYVASVQTGIAKGKDNAGKETISVPYLRVANVQDGYLALDDIAMIEIEPEQLERYRLQPGDVLMNEGGDFDKLGRGSIWRGEVVDCIHQNHVFAVRPHGVSSDWLNCITGSSYAQFFFMGRAKQSTNLASISSTNIMEIPIVLPPEDEQSMLLRFIHEENLRLDELKNQVERSIALLRERRGAVISAAVTGEIDVREAR
jgi:type I restriction enzyme S subunit